MSPLPMKPVSDAIKESVVNGKKLLATIFILMTIAIWWNGCTEPQNPTIHPADWTEPGAENSHTNKIASSGIEVCHACHGGADASDYYGGSSGVSCYDCHEGGPSGHYAWEDWMQPVTADSSHGMAAQTRGFDDCRKCHGQNLDGGTVNLACTLCHTPQQILNW